MKLVREDSGKRGGAAGEGIPYDQRPDDGRGGKVVPMRLQRFLARAGVASRRASENLMTAGRVTVNGAVVTELGAKVDPLVDEVAVDGKPVSLADAPVTIMLHKPAGVITTMKPQSGRPIVASLVPIERYPGLYPIGRLDADATGLLLFSTDGNLGHALLHPSRHVPKTYLVRVREPLNEQEMRRLRTGVELDDGPAQPAEVRVASKDGRLVRITVHEGRYHQVKRMFEAVGHAVVSLHRESFGMLKLGSLKPGQWRVLTEDEVAALGGDGRSGAAARAKASGKARAKAKGGAGANAHGSAAHAQPEVRLKGNMAKKAKQRGPKRGA